MPAATTPAPPLGTVSQIDGGRDDGDKHAVITGAAGEVISVIDEALSSNATMEKENGS